MKKILIGLGVLLVLVLVALFVISSNLGRIIKASIEKFGSQATKTAVTVNSVDLSLRSGSGRVRELQIHNPPAFNGPAAIRFGEISLAIDPSSVRADKLIVRSLRIADGELSLVGGVQDNNLKQIAANLSALAADAKAGKTDPAMDPAAKKKLQVDELALTGLKLNLDLSVPVVGKQKASVTLPDVRLSNLGTGPEGVTALELSEVLMRSVMNEVIPAVTKSVAQQTGGSIGSGGQKALEKVGEFFKKK
ncbi:MAG TPA: hypothetical protein PLX89_13490 [Verrucomicrobiota bacterium]|nr:hypothetical protein [Verrucomicrobiales bacterium]HRI14006.1 hypothetical protein [Verrucomicrobiota bacterium]